MQPNHPSILIVNADAVNEGSIQPTDVLIRNGRIDRMAPQIDAPADVVIEANGMALLPGMIDAHVHFREPGLTHKGTMHSESRAALAGGVTSVMEMPNTRPPAVTLDRLEEKFALAASSMATNYSFYLGASLDNLDQIKAVDGSRICGVKVYLGSTTGDLLVERDDVLDALFRECPVLLAAHCENTGIIRRHEQLFRERYGDRTPFSAHPHIRSEEACFRSTEMAVQLARKYGTRLHVLHLSTARELELFNEGIVRIGSPRENEPFEERDETVRHITSETCIHYLHFDSRAYDTLGARIKCNPAIKRPADREALLRGLLTDHIDTIGTDHAPHTLAEKQGTYWATPSGIPVIESALPALLEHYHDGLLPLETLVEKTAHRPAQIYGIKDRGFLREGYYADLVLADLNAPHTARDETSRSLCGWTPFNGIRFRSSVVATLVSGQVAWIDGQVRPAVQGLPLEFER